MSDLKGEILKIFGLKKEERVVSQQPGPTQQAPGPSVAEQIAQHQATIEASQNMLSQIGIDPIPQDRPIIEAEQAKIAQAQEAISNLQPEQPTPPETPTPEPPPPGIPQVPVAPQTQETVEPVELPKAA